MTISIKSITPENVARSIVDSLYNFTVLLADGDGFEAKIKMGAKTLFDYRDFASFVLEHTGRLHGDGTLQSWSGELRKHLNAHWIAVKRDKDEKSATPPRQQVEVPESLPPPTRVTEFWEDPGIGQAVS